MSRKYVKHRIFLTDIPPISISLSPSIVTNKTRQLYEDRGRCVVEKYDAFQVPLPLNYSNAKIKINGTFTLKENIADIIGTNFLLTE